MIPGFKFVVFDQNEDYGVGAPPGGGTGGKPTATTAELAQARGPKKPVNKKKPIGGMPPGYYVESRIPYTGQGGVPGQILAGGGNPRAAYGPGATIPIQQGVRYFQGDQFNEFPTNSQDIKALQDLMVQAGYLDPKGIMPGQGDPKTINAFVKLLGMANLQGSDWRGTLGAALAASGADGAAAARAAKVPPLVISLTNPDDIKATAQKVSKSLLGQDLPDDELNRFVSTYQQSQTAAQQADYQAKYGQYLATGALGKDSGGTATKEAQTEAGMGLEAEKQIRAQHGPQVTGYQMGSMVMDALNSLRSTGQLPGASGG